MKKAFYFSLILLFCFPQFVVRAESDKQPILVAHRGASHLADENTLKAYALAAEYGMDYIECDPRLTKDGVFVIMHDATVDRTTNGSGEVSQLTLTEIKSMRTENGEQIPTLEEVLVLAKERGIGIFIDTKVNEIPAFEKMIGLIKKFGMEEKVIVMLWWQDAQKWMEKNHPEIATCLSWPAPIPSLKEVKKVGAEWVGALVQYATESMIKNAHKAGLKVITMPINDPEQIQQKIQDGLDVVQTDDPRLVQALRDETGVMK
ncbi:MAG: glycerophosphodiester phosphodiesterase family protein [bacterium]